ncbi:GntR family transcriptional repressor for pyruvate dehydrogenase complex [Arthrobacter sp. V4I6]|uniref:FadR/GntR family transcriptional regulator n=1 Tax=unclassified Arthrobacter TaxID=235627 RepID=UPI002788D91E|nr:MULTISPECIES: FCD domain-containing protein [unclassified Arthrobacter]MDQ0822083.1 GntR family transcriptional repressor for pyruvate dehydrogenase complex [Arthrobacter sp. V1I7]MDQ0856351.1 GntR family transcriptional repressor for pyruvate dehydrogenase complex [Arthrobacter sp. V4I6]
MTSAEAGAPSRRRTYDALLQDIEADLRSGKIKLGDRLPGERTLAESYGISRASVREAIRILDAMGVLRSSVGSGPTSGAIVISDPSAGLSSALRLHVASSRLPVEDIVQTRILLETWSAQTAATRTDVKEELEQAAQLLDAMDDPQMDRAAFHELDVRFHVALSSLARNAVVTTMMESLSGSVVGYVKGAMDVMDAWPDVISVLRTQHHGIFNAVQAHDGELAARLLREHIEWFHQQAQEATAAQAVD